MREVIVLYIINTYTYCVCVCVCVRARARVYIYIYVYASYYKAIPCDFFFLNNMFRLWILPIIFSFLLSFLI